MNLKINPISTANYYHNNIAFNSRSRKLLRNSCYALMAAAMLTTAACSNKNKTDNSQSPASDSLFFDTDSFETQNRVQNIYHYFPTEDGSISSVPDWSEKIYPDGRREIDSLEYKISVDTNGEKTVVKTETDSLGNTVITTNYPDSTKTVQTIHILNSPNEKLESEKTYWSNGKLKENKIYYEHPSDSTDVNSPLSVTENYERYNEKGVLLFWESANNTPDNNDSINTYDSKNRLIFNAAENENYQYKGDEKTPFRSVAEYNGCKRITLYNDSGDVKRIYFEASDGTITEK